MKKPVPTNRVAALAAFLAGIAGCATSIAGVWPNGTTQAIATAGSLLLTWSGPVAHIVGSWLWDRTPAGQAAPVVPPAPVGPIV